MQAGRSGGSVLLMKLWRAVEEGRGGITVYRTPGTLGSQSILSLMRSVPFCVYAGLARVRVKRGSRHGRLNVP